MTENSLNPKDYIEIAKIAAVHGVRGLVKVRSYAERDEDLFSCDVQMGLAGPRVLKMEPKGRTGDALLVKIEGIDDRNAAEALKGQTLYMRREDMPILTSNSFYKADLTGMQVKDANGQTVGEVVAVHNFGASDIIEMKNLDGAAVLLPFTDGFFPELDLANRVITVADWTYSDAG